MQRPMAHEINTALFYWSVKQQLPMAHTPDVDMYAERHQHPLNGVHAGVVDQAAENG
jgi:hypothetical protein